jgi:hypothetical protein
MFYIKMAGLHIQINNKYKYLEELCRDYIVKCVSPDLSVSVTDEQIKAEQADSLSTGVVASAPYAESICMYREICNLMPKYGAFLFHASVVECDGRSYAFAAASGTGKSTHTNLWLEHFGDRARIINGDKPIMRFEDGQLRAYGTPWCGKEGHNINDSSPLTALCFLERGKTNTIRKLGNDESVLRLFPQVLLPTEESAIDMLFPLIEKMIDTVPCYCLACTISDEAVTVAYNAMNNQSQDN